MRCRIVLATCSLLAASSGPSDGLPVRQSPPPKAARPAEAPPTAVSAVNLLKQAGPWVRPDAARRITAQTIFDYMDGGGELYLAYRFDRLDVYEYAAPDRSLGTILVELYWMKGSDDAFGLLSYDWGGEPIDVGGQARGQGRVSADARLRPVRGTFPAVPPHHALYGGGLVRFWSGNLYGRVLAVRESPQSRAQVLGIARSIVEGRPPNGDPPEIVSRIPIGSNGRFTARPERTCFFRSHLVLNSMYYLAAEDILGLGLAVDGSTSEYTPAQKGDRPVRLIQVVYPTPGAATAALRTFLGSYLPAAARPPAGSAGPGTAKLEHGWAAWAARDRTVAVVLDAPGAGAASELATAALAALTRK